MAITSIEPHRSIMTTITLKGEHVTFRLSGLRSMLAFRSSITVPRTSIVGARHDPAVKVQGWRAPGTHLPGVFAAGSFHRKGGTIFWNVRHRTKSIVVDLRDAEFSKLVIEVEDVSAALARLNRIATTNLNPTVP
jgi:hypothetical protein